MKSPRVLIVKKHTAYELRGDAAKHHRDFGFIQADEFNRIARSHEEHYQCLEEFKNALARAQISFEECYHETNDKYPGFDFICTLGGDGTLLEASHGVDDQATIVGIRSSGTSVGHLCAGGIDRIDEVIQHIKAGSFKIKKVVRIEAKVDRAMDGSSFVSNPALNDILFTNANPAATTFYNFVFRSSKQRQKSSGIWISTPVGSTAGTRAAGGKILDQLSTDVQFLVREPYEADIPFTWKAGTFDPSIDSLCIESRCEKAVLALDGLHETIHLEWGDRFWIQRSLPLKLAVIPSSSETSARGSQF